MQLWSKYINFSATINLHIALYLQAHWFIVGLYIFLSDWMEDFLFPIYWKSLRDKRCWITVSVHSPLLRSSTISPLIYHYLERGREPPRNPLALPPGISSIFPIIYCQLLAFVSHQPSFPLLPFPFITNSQHFLDRYFSDFSRVVWSTFALLIQ